MSIDWNQVADDLVHEGLDVVVNADLSELSRWKIGGYASVLVNPKSTEDVVSVVNYCLSRSVPKLVVGDTSNLLFDQSGVNAVIIKIGRAMSSKKTIGRVINVQAGAWVPSLARYSASRGLTGLEHTAGIPGTLGGLVCMNGGSQRKGIGDSVIEIEAVMSNGDLVVFKKSECDFEYRESIFQKNGAIITAVKIELESGDTKNIRRDMLDILKSRRLKFPLKKPNCGSVFASNPKMYDVIGPPGFAIEKVGLKGYSIGGAKISNLHANFFINELNATSEDMLSLIHYAQSKVMEETGFYMHSEVRYVSSGGEIVEANMPKADV